MQNVIERNGWLWPAIDIYGFNAVSEEAKEIHKVIDRCRGLDVAVQAGGNCGLMITPLADAFARVYTFEPDPLNFYCLVHNVPQQNVFKMQSCLGAESGTVSMLLCESNTAAHHVAGSHKGPLRGPVPVMTVDQLRLPACDLLMLDIEGFEMQALYGAQQTIAEFKPVICVELIGHGKRYGVEDETVVSWLRWAGYREAEKLLRDRIFVPA